MFNLGSNFYSGSIHEAVVQQNNKLIPNIEIISIIEIYNSSGFNTRVHNCNEIYVEINGSNRKTNDYTEN
jgi:hypothetical protein